MILRIITTLILVMLSYYAFSQLVIDKKAILKSAENMGINLIKAQQYKKIKDYTEDVHTSYTAIEDLQQQVLDDLGQAESVRDLHWADLSKSLYLATELIKGAVQPGIEVDYVVEHPLFNQNPNDTYRDLFIADGAAALPNDLTSFKQAKQTSRLVSANFQQSAAERKAYAAVAFQYLAEDLILKATEMNEVLKQPERFSMTEAERMRLQAFSEDYLLLSSQLLERSDQMLLEVASVKPMQQQASKQYQQLERNTIAKTTVLDY